MDIEQEPRRRQRLRAPHGADVGHVTAAEPERGRGRPAVDGKAADLGQRHAERLDNVAKRRRPIAGHPRVPITMTRREEHPQLRRETDFRLRPAHPLSMPGARRHLDPAPNLARGGVARRENVAY